MNVPKVTRVLDSDLVLHPKLAILPALGREVPLSVQLKGLDSWSLLWNTRFFVPVSELNWILKPARHMTRNILPTCTDHGVTARCHGSRTFPTSSKGCWAPTAPCSGTLPGPHAFCALGALRGNLETQKPLRKLDWIWLILRFEKNQILRDFLNFEVLQNMMSKSNLFLFSTHDHITTISHPPERFGSTNATGSFQIAWWWNPMLRTNTNHLTVKPQRFNALGANRLPCFRVWSFFLQSFLQSWKHGRFRRCHESHHKFLHVLLCFTMFYWHFFNHRSFRPWWRRCVELNIDESQELCFDLRPTRVLHKCTRLENKNNTVMHVFASMNRSNRYE